MIRFAKPGPLTWLCNAHCREPAVTELQVDNGTSTVCTPLCEEHLRALRDRTLEAVVRHNEMQGVQHGE